MKIAPANAGVVISQPSSELTRAFIFHSLILLLFSGANIRDLMVFTPSEDSHFEPFACVMSRLFSNFSKCKAPRDIIFFSGCVHEKRLICDSCSRRSM